MKFQLSCLGYSDALDELLSELLFMTTSEFVEEDELYHRLEQLTALIGLSSTLSEMKPNIDYSACQLARKRVSAMHEEIIALVYNNQNDHRWVGHFILNENGQLDTDSLAMIISVATDEQMRALCKNQIVLAA